VIASVFKTRPSEGGTRQRSVAGVGGLNGCEVMLSGKWDAEREEAMLSNTCENNSMGRNECHRVFAVAVSEGRLARQEMRSRREGIDLEGEVFRPAVIQIQSRSCFFRTYVW
jgi:hypothetical protein